MTRAVILVAGAYLCVIGAFVHRHVADAAGISLPWGLVLTLAATYAVVHAANRAVPVGGAWLGLGWGAALTAQQFSPGGSYLVASDWLGWSFTAGSLGVIVVGVVRAPRLGQ